MRSVLGSVVSRRRSTTSITLLNASAFGLRGYVDTLSPLVAMHHLDGSCVCKAIFLKLLRSPTIESSSEQDWADFSEEEEEEGCDDPEKEEFWEQFRSSDDEE